MDGDHTRGNSAGASGWVATQVAAEALGADPRTVRTYVSRGILKAKVEGEGVEKACSVDIDSLYALRDARKSSGKRPRKIREKPADAEDFAELIRELTARGVERSSEAAELRTRLQLTEHAQSFLEEEARALRGERDRLRAELEAERSLRVSGPACSGGRGVGEDRGSAGEMSRYTVEEAAAVLGMTIGAVRNRLSKGILRSVEERGAVSTSYYPHTYRAMPPVIRPHTHRAMPPMIPATYRVRRVRSCPRCASG